MLTASANADDVLAGYHIKNRVQFQNHRIRLTVLLERFAIYDHALLPHLLLFEIQTCAWTVEDAHKTMLTTALPPSILLHSLTYPQ
jgi:hypothetical protein